MAKRYISRDGELYHAQHKYVKREWKNGRWVYTYNIKDALNNVKTKIGIQDKPIAKEAVNREQAKKKAENTNSPLGKFDKVSKKGKEKVDKLLSKIKTASANVSDKAKNAVDKITGRTKKQEVYESDKAKQNAAKQKMDNANRAVYNQTTSRVNMNNRVAVKDKRYADKKRLLEAEQARKEYEYQKAQTAKSKKKARR